MFEDSIFDWQCSGYSDRWCYGYAGIDQFLSLVCLEATVVFGKMGRFDLNGLELALSFTWLLFFRWYLDLAVVFGLEFI